DRSAQGWAVFSGDTVAAMRSWARREGLEITLARTNSVSSVRRFEQGAATATAPVLALFIEPEQYPLYGAIALEDGRSLADALSAQPGAGMPGLAWATHPTYRIAHARPVVISSNLRRASALALSEGDVLRVGASEVLYRVAGIVPSDSETILSMPQTVLIDFIY